MVHGKDERSSALEKLGAEVVLGNLLDIDTNPRSKEWSHDLKWTSLRLIKCTGGRWVGGGAGGLGEVLWSAVSVQFCLSTFG